MDLKFTENSCVVVGPIAYHRLALLLFDRTEHMIINATDETEQDREFKEFISTHVASLTGNPKTSWTEVKPKVWEVSPGPGVKLSVFCPEWVVQQGELPTEQPLVSIGSIPVIDPNSLTNELVYDFRNDDDARTKLKRLRSFAHENYGDKPISYIQDDLETRISDYHLASKKWGLRTLESSLTISGTDKILSGACAGLVSAIAGIPLALAAAVGVVAALGTVVVKIQLGRKHFALSQSQDPVSYLVDIQKAVSGG